MSGKNENERRNMTLAWNTGWKPGDIPTIGFVWSPNDDGEWAQRDDGFTRRDLGLSNASSGLIEAAELGPGQATKVVRAGELRFVFVLQGTATLNVEGRGPEPLLPWSAVNLVGGVEHSIDEPSDDFRAVDIAVPAGISGAVDEPSVIVTHEAPDQYVLADGPRAYFDYRDLGTAQSTERRVHVHIVRGTQAVTGGTGWHVHTMSQWFMVLRGKGTIEVDGQGSFEIGPGDSMCLGNGMKHDVSEFSQDYTVLEMCVPADYDTVSAKPTE